LVDSRRTDKPSIVLSVISDFAAGTLTFRDKNNIDFNALQSPFFGAAK
jgi:hypothetical protein